jgi:hypothetical protein
MKPWALSNNNSITLEPLKLLLTQVPRRLLLSNPKKKMARCVLDKTLSQLITMELFQTDSKFITATIER